MLFPGLASDYAAMIRAGIALHEATGEGALPRLQAAAWQDALDAHHADADHGGYFLTADDAEGLIIRPHSTVDDAIPNHNGLIAQNLVRLAVLTGDDRFRAQADAHVRRDPAAGDRQPVRSSLVAERARHASERRGDRGRRARALQAEAATATSRALAARKPDRAACAAMATALPNNHPAPKAKLASVSGAAAFVCRGQTCSLPVTDTGCLLQLVSFQPSSTSGSFSSLS